MLGHSAMSLVPLESLIIGDFSKNYVEEKSDPLNYIFRFLDKDLTTVDRNKDPDYFYKREVFMKKVRTLRISVRENLLFLILQFGIIKESADPLWQHYNLLV